MLRIHVESHSGGVDVRLEGKLVHPWVDELVKVWMDLLRNGGASADLRLDLSDVSFVDGCGRALLAHMSREGCVLHGTGPFIASVIQDVQASTGH